MASCGSYNKAAKVKSLDTAKTAQLDIKSEDTNGKPGNDIDKMTFLIKMNSQIVKSENIILDVEFLNISNNPIRLVNLFQGGQMKINFYGTISYENGSGNIEGLLGPSFADFPRDFAFEYIIIPVKSTYRKSISITQILKEQGKTLPNGSYKIKMGYANIYGKDCIKGSFESNELQFQVQ